MGCVFTDVKDRLKFIEFAHNESVLDEIKKASSLVTSAIKEKKLDIKKLEINLIKVKNFEERNSIIYSTFAHRFH